MAQTAPSRRLTRFAALAPAVLLFPLALVGQTTSVTLSTAASPTSGQAGITAINLTGTGFPTGTITPSAVTVSMKPAAGGTAITTTASAVATVISTTRRVTFTIPAAISVVTPTVYAVSISGTTTTNVAFASSNTASLTVNPGASLVSVNPINAYPGQTVRVTLTGSSTSFLQGSTFATFGAGIAVGGAAEGAAGTVTVTSATTATASIVIDPLATPGPRNVTVSTGSQSATLTGGFTVLLPAPTVTSFTPQSGSAGSVVTITGLNFTSSPQVTLPALNGGMISVPLQSVSANSIGIVIPSGAATGPFTVSNSAGPTVSSTPFTVLAASSFTVSASPATANLIQGQSITYMVQLASTNGFSQLAPLSVSGLPSGVTASFKPTSITAGQTAILTLTAPANQSIASSNLSISAAATVNGIPQSGSTPVSVSVISSTTSLIGQTVVANSAQTPLAGVTISALGLSGNLSSDGVTPQTTNCTGFSAVSDAAGNFALTNLPMQCTGSQLFSVNGTTATSPAGKYAGVNLVFTLVQGQVTASPVLIHLPRIDTAETFMVQQNAASDQSYNFTTIPGLSVTVYAGTTLTMPDGTQPNPFPLSAVQVAIDRLPDLKPNVPTMVRVFIVAFQPANTVASQPVAVSFPNVSNTAPCTDMPLMTLSPIYGTMVPYGTGAVSADGTQVVPDMDPAHPGHRYGLQHFDWHGQMPNLFEQFISWLSDVVKGLFGAGDPVDLASGLHSRSSTDLAIGGPLGSISVQEVYRTQATVDGAFGLGNDLQYAWQLTPAATGCGGTSITLIKPDGNRALFSQQPNGTFTNSSVPQFQGAVMTANGGQTTLRFPNGTLYSFQQFAGVSYLSSMADRLGNTTTFTVAPLNASTLRVTKITDPVGRSINLTYDSNAHVISATDPIGRTVSYTYNTGGSAITLASVTDPSGGVTHYSYNSSNNLVSMTDPRGVVLFQDTLDANGHVTQQLQPDGGVIQFSYTFANPLVAASPIIQTTVTDPLGNQTSYRFNIQGFPTDVTDALGQTTSYTLNPGTNQVTQIFTPGATPGQPSVSFTYDSVGNILTTTDALGKTSTCVYEPVFSNPTACTDPLGHTETSAYDSLGNLISATDANGHTTQFAYNSTGLITRVTDPLGNVTTLGRDSYGDPITATDPLGNTTTTNFDTLSRPILAIDALGRRSTINYDLLGRITSTKDPRGNTTQFAYDPDGNLLTLTDPRGNKTTFTYDVFSRPKTRTSSLGKTESWQYDFNGNATQYTDRAGLVGQFRYDPLNRLIREQYADGSTVARTYDPNSLPLTVNDSLGGFFGFSYDGNGRLLTQAEPNGTVQYTRDALGRVATQQVSGQNPVTFSYDAVGNLAGASSAAAGVSYSYDARNLPTALARTNGVTSSFRFDARAKLSSLVHASGSTAINTQSFGYDPTGKRNSSTNDLGQALITQPSSATFDAANELITGGQTSYSNDANGNRTTETTASGTLTYAWDARHRLSSITDASGNVTAFKYDSGRTLIEIDKTVAGVTTVQKLVYDSLTNVVSLTGPSGLPVSVLTGRSLDSHYASVDSSGNVAFGIGDPLNSTDGVTNATGALTATAAYDPYGQSGTSPPATFPFVFTGRVQITSNIVYFRARFYDTSTGRFLSEDPEDFGAGDTNLYRYAGGDPVNFSDPTGLETAPPGVDPLVWAVNRMNHILFTRIPVIVGAAPFAALGLAELPTLAALLADESGAVSLGFGGATASVDVGATAVAAEVIADGAVIERTYTVGETVIGVLGEASISGTELTISSVAVYPYGVAVANVGVRAILSILNSFAAEAQAAGFTRLIVSGIRYSGANPGKLVTVLRLLGGS